MKVKLNEDIKEQTKMNFHRFEKLTYFVTTFCRIVLEITILMNKNIM